MLIFNKIYAYYFCYRCVSKNIFFYNKYVFDNQYITFKCYKIIKVILYI